MLFKFLLTEFSKSKILSCSQKLDHVTNYYKRPIRFLSDVFGCCHLESATMATSRNDFSSPFNDEFDSRFITTVFVCLLVSEL